MLVNTPTMALEEDSQLIAALHNLSRKSLKLVKSSTYPAPVDPKIVVRSWKMNEFKYYDIPSPFPTLARGLFTVDLPKDEDEAKKDATDVDQRYRIVARGYDKFFNIGEVPWCTWPALEAHTAAPYTLSLKSNGCIIFIAALTPTKLLITSKHSIGPVQNLPVSHAEAGEKWLRKYLAERNKTEEQLAGRLWENNWTAITELCDDSFEEHVLGYPPEKTGLHLHGINEATKAFKTLPQSDVDAFAGEWGFIQTASITLNSIAEVKSFTSECGETGKWNGEAVEGFVVRTHVTAPPIGKGKSSDASPYAPGSSFFFKVKFDEPYMMYRDWRELTKSLLSSKSGLSPAKLPKSKMQRPETRLYVKWVIEEIEKDRKSFQDYTKGKGIIATRERFLKYLEADEGKGQLEKAKTGLKESVSITDKGKQFGKTIIVPVAIPGCGKTAVAVALAHIFGFAHTQSDDVHARKPAPIFIKNVTSLLETHDIVIADKNNHTRRHRQALRDATSNYATPVRLLALNWSIADKPQATTHRVCGDRVQSRGENHQTLRADTSITRSHEEVIWRFINTTEDLAESEVDAVVDMDLEHDLEAAVRRAVDGCVSVLGLEKPSEEKIKESLDVIRGYVPATKKPDEPAKKKGKKASRRGDEEWEDSVLRYFGLLAEVDLVHLLGQKLESLSSDASQTAVPAVQSWGKLKDAGRVSKRPHVTIVHKSSLPGELPLWNSCATLHGSEKPPLFKARLGHLVWNERVMAVTVEGLEVVEGEGARLGKEFLDTLEEEVRERLHITVGTQSQGVPAVEAMDLVQTFRKSDLAPGDEWGVLPLDGHVIHGRIKGLIS
ncbi:RNA ligase [Tricholoma matsutake]|nr:RNA ligase [Tricholoma matsutake 945]